MKPPIAKVNRGPVATPYQVPRHPAQVDLRLDGNEGQVVCRNLLDVLSDQVVDELSHYPSTSNLETTIAKIFNVEREQVLVTAGADDGLLRMCRAYLSPEKELILPVPTFEMIERFANWCFSTVQRVPWTDGVYPVDAVLARLSKRTGLVAVVSPNNPTGGVITGDELVRLSAACPDCMLMVDGAYTEFADEDLTKTALTLPNAVVFRTVSKALGLAGLRVGYAIGPAEIIERLRAMGMPYPVSALSLRLAQAGLERRDQSSRYIETVRKEREALVDLLTELGFQPSRSQGNFVFARTDTAQWWRDGLAAFGIGVRAWTEKPTLSNALRLTCPGDADDFERLEKSLRTIAQPDAILFDIDGVLVDVDASYRSAIIATGAHFGVSIDRADIENCKRAGDANNDWLVTQKLLSKSGVYPAFEDIKAYFEDVYWGTGTTPGLCLNETLIGDRDALLGLANRLPIAAVTGRPRRDALYVLERFGILNAFSAVITMEDGPAKPHPAPVHQALATLGIKRAWMVGDTRDDIIAARAADVLPLAVLSPGTIDPDVTRGELLNQGAARVFKNWMEMEALLSCKF